MKMLFNTESECAGRNALQVFIIEDHASLREALRLYCRSEKDLEVCGTAESAESALIELEACDPEIALVDLSLPGMSGIQFIQAARALRPQLQCLILSGHREREYARQAVAAGAQGYLLKGRPAEIAPALRRAANGERVFSKGMEVIEPAE